MEPKELTNAGLILIDVQKAIDDQAYSGGNRNNIMYRTGLGRAQVAFNCLQLILAREVVH